MRYIQFGWLVDIQAFQDVAEPLRVMSLFSFYWQPDNSVCLKVQCAPFFNSLRCSSTIMVCLTITKCCVVLSNDKLACEVIPWIQPDSIVPSPTCRLVWICLLVFLPSMVSGFSFCLPCCCQISNMIHVRVVQT